MGVFYQVFAQAHPAQFGRVLVHTTIFVHKGPSLPPPSLVSVGSFHTLRRCFPTVQQARKFAALLRKNLSVGPAVLPLSSFPWLRSRYVKKYHCPRRVPAVSQLPLF